MGYHATDTQLSGSKSMLLSVFSSGQWRARSVILSARGSRLNGGARSKYSKTK
eukprot:Gb_34822 [translate_table: standard]